MKKRNVGIAGAKMNIYSRISIQKALDNDDIEAEDAGFMLGYLEER